VIEARVAVPAPFFPNDKLLSYLIPEELVGKVQAGSLVEVPLGARKTWGLVFELGEVSTEAKLKPIHRLKLGAPIFNRPRLDFLRWLSERYFHPIGLVAEAALPGPVRKGTDRTLAFQDVKWEGPWEWPRPDRILTTHQQEALQAILSEPARPHLLWGVTGSGKTEIYLESIRAVLEKGGDALMLVPEIALTPQLTRRFEERFPGAIAVFHSAQKPTELRKAWLDVHTGKKRIAIGARSALFAPLRNPKLLILDEEHDSSYKQEEMLRYHARECLLKLAQIYGAPSILGSATPSAESLYAVKQGKMSVSRMPERAVKNARLPDIEILDLKKHMAVQNKNPSPKWESDDLGPTIKGDFFLGPQMRSSLEATLGQGKQAILFLNRRGLGSQLFCRGCGHVMDCPNCDVKLTPHRSGLLCHYCGYDVQVPTKCPECGEDREPFVEVGIGTESVQKALEFHFPKARVLRMDRDTITNGTELENVLGAFGRAEADILVGTQMVAKGHDFPDVTLVGILLGDLGLSVPDFRTWERNLQLLLQVSGRAGRADHPGRVLLQTFQPEHPVFQGLLAQGSFDAYEAFIDEELAKRSALLYPPIARLSILRFDGLDLGLVAEAARAVGAALKKIHSTDLKVLGPIASPLSKLRGRYRWQILLKASNDAAHDKALQWILAGWHSAKLERKFKTRLVVDVDPANIL
jgi:primosomal protein N' (replication factor Y)